MCEKSPACRVGRPEKSRAANQTVSQRAIRERRCCARAGSPPWRRAGWSPRVGQLAEQAYPGAQMDVIHPQDVAIVVELALADHWLDGETTGLGGHGGAQLPSFGDEPRRPGASAGPPWTTRVRGTPSGSRCPTSAPLPRPGGRGGGSRGAARLRPRFGGGLRVRSTRRPAGGCDGSTGPTAALRSAPPTACLPENPAHAGRVRRPSRLP